jgi:diguanylate cyclase (GGDEF)-like protein
MDTHWRKTRRWFATHRARAMDAFWLGCASGIVALVMVFGVSPLQAMQPELADVAWRLSLWLVFTLCAAIMYAARRWREIDVLLQEAETDPLTGLSNRRKIESWLAREFDRALRYERPLSIVMMDIDHFKRVNDSYGHAIGDLVLTSIARRITRRMRVSDHFGRWGGEEFILICPETDTTDAMLVADRMRRTIRQKPMRKAGTVTASFGVSTYSGQGDYEDLIAEADAYLYVAKQQGRDRTISRLVVMAQDRMRKEGIPIEVDARPEDYNTFEHLSTIVSTIAEPIRRRVSRRRSDKL